MPSAAPGVFAPPPQPSFQGLSPLPPPFQAWSSQLDETAAAPPVPVALPRVRPRRVSSRPARGLLA